MSKTITLPYEEYLEMNWKAKLIDDLKGNDNYGIAVFARHDPSLKIMKAFILRKDSEHFKKLYLDITGKVYCEENK